MQNSQSQTVSQQTKDLIDKLVLGKLSLAEISKITGISDQWLQIYVNAKYDWVSK
jgi:insertion element IS1 protein InsB